ncbi:hypothetical protein FCJ61_09255 [Burkholderia metallica]|uniref:hypothetical protein n=1 Tax=Burkholderia metallica TaxID=488729 RepID=UPI00157B4140|nr:hypothetical protein [Burkholderia metallica]NTZ83175.1 hypothetical protein [Burkholderia metallica]
MATSITRRCWLAAALAASCVALSGCHTSNAYVKHPADDDAFLESGLFREQPYDEAVTGFMITEDRKRLIVLGRPFHFVLDLPNTLQSALSARYRPSLRWKFTGFRAVGGHAKGRYRVVLAHDASALDRQAATADGFVAVPDGLALEGTIAGMRYLTGGFDMPSRVTAPLLDRPYTIYARHVTQALAPVNLAMQPTPITAAANGALELGGMALVPVELAVTQAPRD